MTAYNDDVLPDLSAFECKLCFGRDDDIPVHTKWLHYASGWPVIEFEWILDRRPTPEHLEEYMDLAEGELWPWTLENLTQVFIRQGYKIVWMRRAAVTSTD